jgi:Tol biopolymer transport system component
VDFGLAKLVQAGQATTSGARAMTPGYSPPEQYGGARTDPRSDIYSLGATLYAALSGNIPEDGLARAMDNAQLTPLRKRNPRISRRLAAAIEKAMAIDPSDRFQQAEDFKKALLNSKSRTVQLAGAGYAVSSAPVSLETATPRPAINKEAARSPALSISPGPDDQPAFVSPQKKQLAKERRRARRLRRFLLAALVLTLGIIAFTAPGVLPASLQLFAAGVKLASLPSGPATLPAATEPGPTLPATASPAATAPASTPTRIPEPTYTATAQSSPATSVALPLPARTPIGGGAGEIAFASSRDGVPQIFLTDLSGSEARQLTDLPEGACQPTWSPDGQYLIFVSPCGGMDEVLYQARLHMVHADGSGLEPIPSSQPGDFEPAWSPDGTRVAFTSVRSGATELYVLHLGDESVVQLTNGSSDLQSRQAAWSPDGRQIAYTVKRFGTVFQVWLMDANGGNQRQLVRSGIRFSDYLPSWTPDGASVMFNHRRADTPALPYLMMIASENPEDEQGAALALQIFPIEDASYSADGLWIVYEGEVEQQDRDILVVSAAGGEELRLTASAGLDFDPAWRPAITP